MLCDFNDESDNLDYKHLLDYLNIKESRTSNVSKNRDSNFEMDKQSQKIAELIKKHMLSYIDELNVVKNNPSSENFYHLFRTFLKLNDSVSHEVT